MSAVKFVASAVIAGGAVAMLTGHHASLFRTPAATAAAHSPGQARGAAAVIAFARAQLGKPYVYGAPRWSPGAPVPGSYDCASLTQWAWAAAGVSIPQTSETQWASLRHISRSQLRPGDLVFETGAPVDSPPGHVYLYTGHGKAIEAYAAGYPVRVIDVRWPYATGFARVN